MFVCHKHDYSIHSKDIIGNKMLSSALISCEWNGPLTDGGQKHYLFMRGIILQTGHKGTFNRPASWTEY